MSRIAYFRVSADDQSIASQRVELGGSFDREFIDEDVSGMVLAADRPGFSAMLTYVRDGDTLCVAAVDRLGRDALDIQGNVRKLLDMGVGVEIVGLGRIAKGVGEIIVAVLAQVAELERRRIRERTAAGREAAKASLATTGRTHKGKASLGRPKAAEPREVAAWRKANNASIKATSEHFRVSRATVSRYCGEAA